MSVEDKHRKNLNDFQDVENPENSENQTLEQKWHVIKKEYQKKYPILNDNDLIFLPGEFFTMLSLIASKTERCASEVNNELRNWDV